MTEPVVDWGSLKAHELRELAKRETVVIVPVAAMEQHGPHLPTGTDTILGREVGRRAARLAWPERPVVVTESVWCGISEHHMPFGGTISLDFSTFRAVIRGIVGSIARHGFKRVWLMNSHGGNANAIRIIADELAAELGIRVAASTYWLLARPEMAELLEKQSGIRHACEGETSMIMALHPELVDASRLAEADTPDNRDASAGPERDLHVWSSFAAKTKSGALGVPSAATPEKGQKMLDAAAEVVAGRLRDEALWRLDPAPAR
ncbi:creatininase family protein [Marinimicrococcus flavescens]|uniref:Creatininase family protein n=1 Tax=Marinimicrococcus flavescens TaxID=3031815 RepID=A0AAP4D6L0_9PROT|nr:creatininase family protein [Marinimicrococcus flavescens]